MSTKTDAPEVFLGTILHPSHGIAEVWGPEAMRQRADGLLTSSSAHTPVFLPAPLRLVPWARGQPSRSDVG